MKQFVPMEKRQKKLQREFAAKQRGNWSGVNPVTRKPENSKAYHREKAGRWRKDSSHDLPFSMSVRLDFMGCVPMIMFAE